MPLNRLGFTKSTLFFAGIYAPPHTFSALLHHPSTTAPTKNFSIKRFQTAASQFPNLMIPFKLFDSVDFQLCRVPYFPLYDCFMIIFHIILCQFSIVLFQLFRKKIPDVILLHKQISLVFFILKDANNRNRSPTRFAMHSRNIFGIQHSRYFRWLPSLQKLTKNPPHHFRLPFIYYQMPRLILIVSQKTSGINVRDSLLKPGTDSPPGVFGNIL